MTQSAEIVSVSQDNKEALVCPIVTNACLSCKEGCSRRGSPFTALNKKNLQIKKGDLAVIAASKSAEAAQAVVSLLIPAACAVAALQLANPISLALWKVPSSEGFKALCVLAGILIPSAAALALSRFKIRPSKPYIEKVF